MRLLPLRAGRQAGCWWWWRWCNAPVPLRRSAGPPCCTAQPVVEVQAEAVRGTPSAPRFPAITRAQRTSTYRSSPEIKMAGHRLLRCHARPPASRTIISIHPVITSGARCGRQAGVWCTCVISRGSPSSCGPQELPPRGSRVRGHARAGGRQAGRRAAPARPSPG